MTRADQMLKTTAAIQGTLLNQGHSNQYAEAFADGFYEGALYADKNPYPDWHKCDEKMPENTDYEYKVTNANDKLDCYYISENNIIAE